MHEKPAIVLAFANDQDDPQNYLEELEKERLSLDDMLTKCEHCHHQIRTEANNNRILETFEKFKDAVRIFHFSGHGNPNSLQTGKKGSEHPFAHAKALAGYIARVSEVKLVFLNACATHEQVLAFHKAGIPIVISTTLPVLDKAAREFAEHFYRALINGLSIRASFEAAEEALMIPYADPISLYRDREVNLADFLEEELRYPYKIEVNKQGLADEGLKDWYLRPLGIKTPEQNQESLKLGPKAFLRCNRDPQRKNFAKTFRAQIKGTKHKPQIILMHGPEHEEAHSLTERLRQFELKEILKPYVGKARYFYQHVELPTGKDFEVEEDSLYPWKWLKSQLASAFRVQEDPNLDAWRLLHAVSMQEKVIWIEHRINVSDWNPAMLSFLIDYFQKFWNLDLGPRHPYVIVSLSISYTPVSGLKRLLNRRKKQPIKILKELDKNIEGSILFEELSAPVRQDVTNWRKENLPNGIEPDLEAHIFGKAGRLPMRKVEAGLRLIVEKHRQQIPQNMIRTA